jgi:hypothetical protein
VNWLQERYRRIFFNGCSIFRDAGWRHCGLSHETGAVWRRTLPTRRSVSTIRSLREPSGCSALPEWNLSRARLIQVPASIQNNSGRSQGPAVGSVVG